MTADQRTAAAVSTAVDAGSVHHDLTTVNRLLRSRAYGSGLTAGAAAALWTIVHHAPLRLSALAELEGVSAPTMSKIVTSLERDGYVDRTPDPDDARARLLEPTATGRDLVTNVRSVRVGELATALDRLGADDRETVQHGLRLLAAALITA
ncbi:MAG: MarR family transcriptional regulator [Gordonia sp. (in: high G+C Gram-positive bacteria)]|uniref:MarR family winged helix-turn-helix transcriptional regulator n=1 Tax=Gordonia sp. (in: high G+C Gram-positive bacteria) TaxID=84139 RepID=UPI0039E68934